MTFNRGFNGRGVVKASTKQGLIEKIADRETRDWKQISEISQHEYSSYYWCVMELTTFKVVALNG